MTGGDTSRGGTGSSSKGRTGGTGGKKEGSGWVTSARGNSIGKNPSSKKGGATQWSFSRDRDGGRARVWREETEKLIGNTLRQRWGDPFCFPGKTMPTNGPRAGGTNECSRRGVPPKTVAEGPRSAIMLGRWALLGNRLQWGVAEGDGARVTVAYCEQLGGTSPFKGGETGKASCHRRVRFGQGVVRVKQ